MAALPSLELELAGRVCAPPKSYLPPLMLRRRASCAATVCRAAATRSQSAVVVRTKKLPALDLEQQPEPPLCCAPAA